MKRRGKNPNANPGVRPVERIELSEKSPKKRLIIVISLIAFALIMFAVAIISALSVPGGWTRIEPANSSADTVAIDFVFSYNLGASGASPKEEYRELSRLYSGLCHSAYTLFCADREFDGVKNPYYISKHIGEEVTVDPVLYEAFALLEEYDSRLLFAAPYYDNYRNMFSLTEDGMAAQYDPYLSAEVAEYFSQLAVFVNDEAHIKLELLGSNRVRLSVSPEYQSFASANGIDRFIDFYWTKNAFAVDFIADSLQDSGYVNGYISSRDGFTRNLTPDETVFSMTLPCRYEGETYAGARYDYKGRNSVVFLRSYSVDASDEIYYTYSDGSVRSAYVDIADGLCKTALDGLVSYSNEMGCAEVLLGMIPSFIADDFDTLPAVDGVCSIAIDGIDMTYTQEDIMLTLNTALENIKLTAKLAE